MSTQLQKVALIEDNEDYQLIIKTALENRWPEIKISAAGDLSSGLDMLQNDKFELLILDLDLPDSAGLNTLHSVVKANNSICIVILTNYRDEEKAIEALHIGAADYQFKDTLVDTEAFTRSLLLSKERFQLNNREESNVAVEQNSVFVKEGRDLVKLTVEDIIWLEALGDYTVVKTRSKTHKILMLLRIFLNKLPEESFIRIHRSYAVNMKAIETIRRGSLIAGGDELPIGESFKKELTSRVAIL